MIIKAEAKNVLSTKIIRRIFSLVSYTFSKFQQRTCSTNVENKIAVAADGQKANNQGSLPKHHLSYTDKLTLKWFGNVKGEIPREVSYATMEKAESKRRIAVNLFLVAFCGFGSMYVVYNVKKDLSNESQDSIYAQNRKRYHQDGSEKT